MFMSASSFIPSRAHAATVANKISSVSQQSTGAYPEFYRGAYNTKNFAAMPTLTDSAHPLPHPLLGVHY